MRWWEATGTCPHVSDKAAACHWRALSVYLDLQSHTSTLVHKHQHRRWQKGWTHKHCITWGSFRWCSPIPYPKYVSSSRLIPLLLKMHFKWSQGTMIWGSSFGLWLWDTVPGNGLGRHYCLMVTYHVTERLPGVGIFPQPLPTYSEAQKWGWKEDENWL